MRTHPVHAAAVLAILATASPTARSVASPAPFRTVEFEAKSVGRTMKYNVVLPGDYAAKSDRYPVRYLLHG
jgi:predicted peptidase